MHGEQTNNTMEQHEVSESTTKKLIHGATLFLSRLQKCNRIVSFLKAKLKSSKPLLKEQVDKILLPKVYVPEFVQTSSIHNVRKLANFKGKSRRAVIHLYKSVN